MDVALVEFVEFACSTDVLKTQLDPASDAFVRLKISTSDRRER